MSEVEAFCGASPTCCSSLQTGELFLMVEILGVTNKLRNYNTLISYFGRVCSSLMGFWDSWKIRTGKKIGFFSELVKRFIMLGNMMFL